MAWVQNDNKNTSDLKPTWEYKKGSDFVTVLPDTSRDFALITGDLDPTKTWSSPIEVWVHQFKVQKGFATVICDKWNEACPFCYENEMFKLANPKYRDENRKPPFPISSKALLQVYDFQEKRVLWLIAGQSIIEGMDFILTRQANMFRGIVTITRTGSKLNTKYRVDISHAVLTSEQMATIKAQTAPMNAVRSYIKLSHAEILQKTGVDPVQYFERVLPQRHQIDISGWGAVPTRGSAVPQSAPQAQMPSAQQSAAQPPAQETGAGVPAPADPAVVQAVAQAIEVKCTMGVYAGKGMAEIFIATGKSYMQYMSQAGASAEEKTAAKTILDNWDLAVSLADASRGAF